MTNTKNTKRALLASVMALFLCFSMLLGTTFAWFTDSVTSGNNIIKSGTLDVEMYWAYGTEDPDSATWTDASTGAIFNYDKWEPGYTEVRHIKIANAGSLALKYQLAIIPNGAVSDLADVIDVYFVDGGMQVADRTALASATPVGTLTEVLAAMPANVAGDLVAGASDIVTIALKMQESAGNEYQNLSIGSDFSVQLVATQLTAEEDSFGPNYDTNSKYPASIAVSQPVADENDDGLADAAVTLTYNDAAASVSAVKATVPAGAKLEEGVEELTLTITEQDEVNSNVTVSSTQQATTYEIDIDGVADYNTEPIEVKLTIATGLVDVKLYHESIEIPCTYDSATGDLIFTTTGFSPFTVVHKAIYTSVSTADELVAAFAKGGEVVLAADITVSESMTIPAGVTVNLDLNGKKITSNLTSDRAILVQGAAEIKNGTITTTNGVGAIFATGKSASLILTDMTVAVTGTGTNKEWILTAVGAANGAKVVINNGTYSAEKGYGLVVSTTGADVTINDGIFTTEGTTESAAVRFDSGWDNSKVYTKAVINGGVFNAPEGGFAFTANNAYGKDITINGGTFNGKVASHYQDNGVVINGGIFNDKLFEGGNHTDKYQIKGGTFSFDPTKRVAEGFKVVDANGTYYVVADDVTVAYDAAGLEKAINAGTKVVILAEGDYALRFTNNTNFNLNDMTIKGLGDVNLAISSSEAWYGRVQGSNVTFENIHFTSSVGATGKAIYNDCTFDSWAICASSNNEKTTFNNCTINGCLNTSTDFSSGDVSVNNCQIAKAEYSGSMTMNFVNCQIGEIIIWNADTNLTNCQVTTLDTSNVTNATVTIK